MGVVDQLANVLELTEETEPKNCATTAAECRTLALNLLDRLDSGRSHELPRLDGLNDVQAAIIKRRPQVLYMMTNFSLQSNRTSSCLVTTPMLLRNALMCKDYELSQDCMAFVRERILQALQHFKYSSSSSLNREESFSACNTANNLQGS